MNKWNNKAINKMEDQQINKKKEPYVFCCVDRLDWIQETRDSPESESILSYGFGNYFPIVIHSFSTHSNMPTLN